MSQAKPVAKKVQKKSSFWENAKFFALSLWSNDYCVEARKKPWYSAVIIALLSVFIAAAPTTYTYFSKQGSDFFSSPTYGLENALVDFDQKMADNNVNLVISDDQLNVSDTTNNFKSICVGADGTTSQAYYGHYYTKTVVATPSTDSSSSDSSSSSEATSTVPTVTEETYCDLAVYCYSGDDMYSYVTTTILGGADPNSAFRDVSTYSTSFICFGKDGFYAYKEPSGTSSAVASYYFKWDSSYIQNFSLANLATESTHQVAYSVTANQDITTYTSETLSAWKEFFTDAWDSTRINLGWSYGGISLAINASLTLILGLTVFLMTRGKNNPFSSYTFWDGQKIAYWASFTPALLSLFGFIPAISSWALLLFVFLFGIRIMWMSGRSLRPTYEQ